jgi:streptogramin lyase
LNRPYPRPHGWFRSGSNTPQPARIDAGVAQSPAPGLGLAPNGDILVTNFDPFTNPPTLLRVDPVTGAVSVLSSGGLFVTPMDVVVTVTGDVFVVDRNAFGGGGGIIRVDPSTGDQTMFASGGSFVESDSIVIAPTGEFVVANFDAASNDAVDLVLVDPLTGAQSVLSLGSTIIQARGVDFDPNGHIWVAGSRVGGPGVTGVDPLTGVQGGLSNNGFFRSPMGLVVVPATNSQAVPEPSTFGLCAAAGLVWLIGRRRRRRASRV